eukprot:1816376-Amphidinium_carterae.1
MVLPLVCSSQIMMGCLQPPTYNATTVAQLCTRQTVCDQDFIEPLTQPKEKTSMSEKMHRILQEASSDTFAQSAAAWAKATTKCAK